jgi:hypothetical protein
MKYILSIIICMLLGGCGLLDVIDFIKYGRSKTNELSQEEHKDIEFIDYGQRDPNELNEEERKDIEFIDYEQRETNELSEEERKDVELNLIRIDNQRRWDEMDARLKKIQKPPPHPKAGKNLFPQERKRLIRSRQPPLIVMPPRWKGPATPHRNGKPGHSGNGGARHHH